MSLVSQFTNLIKTKVSNAHSEAMSQVMTQVQSDVDQYVPYDTGNLARSSKIRGTTISFASPYADYAFYGYTSSNKPKRYKVDVHPKATANPIGVAKANHRTAWAALYVKRLVSIIARGH